MAHTHDHHTAVAGAGHTVLLVLHYAQLLRHCHAMKHNRISVVMCVSPALLSQTRPSSSTLQQQSAQPRRRRREGGLSVGHVMRASASCRRSASCTLRTTRADRTFAKNPSSYASFLWWVGNETGFGSRNAPSRTSPEVGGICPRPRHSAAAELNACQVPAECYNYALDERRQAHSL